LVTSMKFYIDRSMSVCRRSPSQTTGFHEMVDVCDLYDLGFEGCSSTFEKKVAGGSYCYVRMDCAIFSILECQVPCSFGETPLIGCLRPYSYLVVVELEKGTTTSQRTL
jgi:hypothetical protein